MQSEKQSFNKIVRWVCNKEKNTPSGIIRNDLECITLVVFPG